MAPSGERLRDKGSYSVVAGKNVWSTVAAPGWESWETKGQRFLQGARGYGALPSPSGVQGQSPGLVSGGWSNSTISTALSLIMQLSDGGGNEGGSNLPRAAAPTAPPPWSCHWWSISERLYIRRYTKCTPLLLLLPEKKLRNGVREFIINWLYVLSARTERVKIADVLWDWATLTHGLLFGSTLIFLILFDDLRLHLPAHKHANDSLLYSLTSQYSTVVLTVVRVMIDIGRLGLP